MPNFLVPLPLGDIRLSPKCLFNESNGDKRNPKLDLVLVM